MAKNTKSESKTKQIVDKTIKKDTNKNNIKNLTVKIHKMTPREIELHTKADFFIVKKIEIGISEGVLSIHNDQIKSSSNVFDIKLKLNSSETTIESIVPSSSIQQRSTNKTLDKTIESIVATSSGQQRSTVKTLDTLIRSAWNQCKKDFNEDLVVGNIVMAKMTGYSPWASRIEGFSKNKKKTNVYFFGTNNRGSVNSNEIVPFSRCHSLIRLLILRKFSEFHKSVLEVENLLGIEPKHSLLNPTESLANSE